MKKNIIPILLSIFLSFSGVVFAENTEFLPENPEEDVQISYPFPLTSDKFTLWIEVLPPKGVFVPSVLKVDLQNHEGKPILSGEANVEGPGTLKIDFPLGTYEIGTKFRLILTEGAESAVYYTDTFSPGDAFTTETYAYRGPYGELVISDCAHISVVPLSEPWDITAEKFVKERGIDSKTDYLVWVSKKNFTVSVFLKRDYGWDCIRQMGCSIGAPSTPTVTGEFTYHQYQNKWFYDGYYVGPVMRFYGGYAIHSTLINNDRTNRDARLKRQISHGCVRVLPEDARWLTDYVPIGTKIYVTEN